MRIETDRLLIRPWTLDDCAHYQAMSTDVGFNCFTPPGIYLTRDEEDLRDKVRLRIRRFEEQGITKFPVFEKQTGRFVGICGADWFDLKRAQPPAPGAATGELEVELGYRLMLEHWGKGYASEAARAMIPFVHQSLQRKVIYAFALPQNTQSLKIIEKTGFNFERDFNWAGLSHRLYRHSI